MHEFFLSERSLAQYFTDFSIFGLTPYWKKCKVVPLQIEVCILLWDLQSKKYAKIAVSRLLESLKSKNFPGRCPWTPLGGGDLQRPPNPPAVNSLTTLGRLPRCARSCSAIHSNRKTFSVFFFCLWTPLCIWHHYKSKGFSISPFFFVELGYLRWSRVKLNSLLLYRYILAIW